MGTGCSSIIEYRRAGEERWRLLVEKTGDRCILRGWDLYYLLDVFGPGFDYEVGEPKALFERRGPPPGMSEDLEKLLWREDWDAKERMSWLTLAELEQVSKVWDDYLVSAGEPGDPETASVTLRRRLAAAKECAAETGGEVRMVYWFSS
jgi:hypothetical protein